MNIFSAIIKIIKENYSIFALAVAFVVITSILTVDQKIEIITLKPIEDDTLIVCATFALTILIAILTSSKYTAIKEYKRINAIKNGKCLLSFLFFYLIFHVGIGFIKIPIASQQCNLITMLDASYFIFYVFTIIFLVVLFYNLVEFFDDLQGYLQREKNTEQIQPKKSTELAQQKNNTELSQQENMHIHIHIHKE